MKNLRSEEEPIAITDRILRDTKNLFEHEKENYKSVKTDIFGANI